MKFFEIEVYTMFCGEDNWFYVECESEEEAIQIAIEESSANAMEWFDEEEALQEGYTEEEYLDQCGYRIRELSEKEYRECT